MASYNSGMRYAVTYEELRELIKKQPLETAQIILNELCDRVEHLEKEVSKKSEPPIMRSVPIDEHKLDFSTTV